MPVLLKLFFAFFQVGLFSVGGGYAAIPLIQSQIVDKYQLMTIDEFTNLITIAEMTPGSIAINSSTFVGTRLAGPFGAIICTIGCILPSLIICFILAYFYYKYRKLGGIQTVLGALRPAVVALIGSAGATILVLALFGTDIFSVQIGDFKVIEFVIFAAALFCLRKFKISSVAAIIGSGIIGTAAYLLFDLI